MDLTMDVLVTEELVGSSLETLARKHAVVHEARLWQDLIRLRELIAGARTIMVRNQTQVTAELVAAAPRLLAIGRLGVGLDNIDLEAAARHGVVVIAPLEANAGSVADLTLGLLLCLARKIPAADRSTRAGGWDRKGFLGMELDGKTLAVVGFGRIGRRVALRARAFGLRVLAFDPFLEPDSPLLAGDGAVLHAHVEDALARADFTSVHVPLTPKTRGLFDTRLFQAMKRGAFFINTSRGGVVDEAALLWALEGGHLGGAALDVREVEPPTGPNRLAALENVVLTPHIASFTPEAQARTFETVAADIERVLAGEPAHSFVNFARPRR